MSRRVRLAGRVTLGCCHGHVMSTRLQYLWRGLLNVYLNYSLKDDSLFFKYNSHSTINSLRSTSITTSILSKQYKPQSPIMSSAPVQNQVNPHTTPINDHSHTVTNTSIPRPSRTRASPTARTSPKSPPSTTTPPTPATPRLAAKTTLPARPSTACRRPMCLLLASLATAPTKSTTRTSSALLVAIPALRIGGTFCRK